MTMPSLIKNYNSPQNPIWVVISEPYAKDAEHGYIFSCGYGYNFKKVWSLAGLSYDDCHIRSIRPCLGASYNHDVSLSNFLLEVEKYKPRIIVPLDDEVLNYLVPVTRQIKEKNSSLRKWAGSILQSKYISYPHYVIGSHDPSWVTANWDYYEIQAFIDFGHVRDEFNYYVTNNILNPLPQRRLITEPPFDTLIDYLRSCLDDFRNNRIRYVSHDIETIRPKKKSFYYLSGHPGYPYTSAIAKSPTEGISFSFWDYPPDQSIILWRTLNKLFSTVPQIGQNYFLFDSHYMEALGFDLCLDKCQDTYFRHHILWPGLEHKLQFQTKQYTRQSFYKDEGKNWSSKNKGQLFRYNALDATVTFEIWEEQEKEFDDRPHLR